MSKIFVHGYMVYRCEKCGKEFRMWCEKGVEDRNETLHSVPSPFVIHHSCGGFAQDISGLFRYDAGYMLLPEKESYFAYDKNKDCGIAVLKESESE